MSGQSAQVVLTGKAGIGKTASAVCCAKELDSKGKNVVWISEVMVKGWTNQASTMEELEQCRTDIRKSLNGAPDAVILDDDNLAGYAGKVLLEEIYSWFVSNPGKGLYITSNEALSFEPLYGLRLDQSYDCVPFPGYDSPQYVNTIRRIGLDGTSLRKTEFDRASLPASEVKRMELLAKMVLPQSAGIVVGFDAYEQGKDFFGDNVEFIPGFQSLAPIRYSLIQTGCLGEAYDKLTANQKKWLRQWHDPGGVAISTSFGTEYTKPKECISVRQFVQTAAPVIAVELLEKQHWKGYKIIEYFCFKQLMSVINFAHDQGGKRVVIINHTDTFFNEGLLEQIFKQIPDAEKQRTTDRLKLLLGIH